MSCFFPTLLLATAVAGAAAAVDAPIASDVLSRMGFGPRDLQRVLDGKFVQRDVKSDAKDDLAVALSFLVRVPPERFDHDLTQKEAMILQTLADREGEVVSRDDILDAVWGYEVFPSTRTIDNFIVRLRKRFERRPDDPLHFHTVRGIGYRFTSKDET